MPENSHKSATLKFRSCYTRKPGLDVDAVIEACQEFRQACRWWIKGERKTRTMFRDIADYGVFIEKLKSAGILNGQSSEMSPLKREVELCGQFADAINLTYFETREVPEAFKGLGMTQQEVRERVFIHELERVLSF